MCDKLVSLTLLSLLVYQVYYNYEGGMELGGKYAEWPNLIYSIGSLIPGLALAVVQVRLAFANTDAEKAELIGDGKNYKYCCRYFYGIVALCALYLTFARFQHRM